LHKKKERWRDSGEGKRERRGESERECVREKEREGEGGIERVGNKERGKEKERERVRERGCKLQQQPPPRQQSCKIFKSIL
jgi:hypothetical protein